VNQWKTRDIVPLVYNIFCVKSYKKCSTYWTFFLWRCGPARARASSFLRFLGHKQRRTTVGRTPLDEWSARRRDLYLTTQQSQQKNIHAPGGIQTHNLSRRVAADLRTATEYGYILNSIHMILRCVYYFLREFVYTYLLMALLCYCGLRP